MAFQWMRRVLLALAPAALLALTACGSGTIESQFHPSRLVVFGDGLSDMGNTGSRFTVNDGTPMWSNILALDYGISLAPSASGGTDYATGNARVTQQPDAAGNAATPTIQQQVDTYLAAGAPGAGDLIIVQGGISDIITQMAALRAGTISSSAMVANSTQAGVDLAAQVKRLLAAGATHIAVLGTYDLGKTPWATNISQQAQLSAASLAFNNAVLVNLVQQGSNVLYVDTALLVNLMVANPPAYSFGDGTSVACASIDPGPGIGIGNGQVNSQLCTPSTIVPGVNYATAMWADFVYMTPLGQTTLANYAFTRIHSRF